LDDCSAQVFPSNIFAYCSICKVDCKFARNKKNLSLIKRTSSIFQNCIHLILNVIFGTLEKKCLAIRALFPIVASPSKDLLRREASSSSGICDSDRRRVSWTSSRPPVESVADALRWGPEQKSIHAFKRQPKVRRRLGQY
jgi:hypothetical protein